MARRHSLCLAAGAGVGSWGGIMSGNVIDGGRQRGASLPKYYAIKSVAEALEVSTRTVRRWIAKRALAAHRVDGVVRISEADLRAFLAMHREG